MARNDDMVEQYRAGATLQQIGDRYGVSRERVRQIVRSLDAGPAGARPRQPQRHGHGKRQAGGEQVRLRIGNLAKAVLVTGQAYQDPKDALNEFVSNAADAYAETDRRGERIRVLLRRKGKSPVVVVDDDGPGMSPDRLRDVARNLFESAKSGDDRTLGEKAIGLLAFQQLANQCAIVSRAEGSDETWALRLQRGDVNASLARERRRSRDRPGTTVYLSELDPEVVRVLTRHKVVEYLRRRRSAALEAGAYTLEVVEGRTVELVTAEEPEGVRLDIPAQSTLWGRIEFALYVAPDPDRRRRVAVVGRAGTTIVDHLGTLDDFDHDPWTSGQVSGRILFGALQQTAGRRAVLRDGDAFPVFRHAVTGVEPLVVRTIERLRRHIDEQAADRVADVVRHVFERVLKELADLENPMHTLVGDEPGTGGLLARRADGAGADDPSADDPVDALPPEPRLDELEPDQSVAANPDRPTGSGAGQPARRRNLPSVAPDPEPGHARSRFEADAGTVLYNDRHPDYLLVKDDEPALLDYLSTLVAKEYVVYNNPRSSSEDLAEEMVRMLVRIRRHLPRRR